MADKPIRQPGPDHPIRIERNPARLTVAVDGQVIADTSNALTLWEANYRPVQYIPLTDVDTSLLQITTPIARTRAIAATTRSWPADRRPSRGLDL